MIKSVLIHLAQECLLQTAKINKEKATLRKTFLDWNTFFAQGEGLNQGCATFFVGGPYNQLQTSSWATRNI